VKNFVKALERNGPAFLFLFENFPSVTTEKMKTGAFIGIQIRLLSRDPQFDLFLSDDHKAAWNAFRHVATAFLGNVKAINSKRLLEDFITCNEKLGCNMSLKMHFLRSTVGLLSG
jgi:hypothetical protein